MKKIKVACLFGGCSSEYGISLESASSIIENMNKDKYDIKLIGITKDGNFYEYNGDVDKIKNDEWLNDSLCKKITISSNREDHGYIVLDESRVEKIDVAFPILHGKNGEDGRLQGLFELANIPYAGCDMISSAICMDKFITHELVRNYGIEAPRGFIINKYSDLDKTKELINVNKLNFPLFVKPLKAGSSYGISKIHSTDELEKALEEAFKFDDKVIVEENIDGFEVGCAVLGNNELIIGEVDEIELVGEFFNFEEKYGNRSSKIHLPARLSDEVKENIKSTALAIYNVLGCKGFARVDMFYTPDGKVVLNEVNTIPGCTSHSRFPSMLKMVGYSFEEVIDKIIELALED